MKGLLFQKLNFRIILFLLGSLAYWTSPYHSKKSAPAESFIAKFETTQGSFKIEAKRKWAPLGYERLYDLIQSGFYSKMAIYRVIPGAVAQFGIHNERKLNDQWNQRALLDDPVVESNDQWTISFAKAGEHSRGTEIFINLNKNRELDEQGFAVVAKVKNGLEVIEAFYDGYGDDIRKDMNGIIQAGNLFLGAKYPKLDYIIQATIIKEK